MDDARIHEFESKYHCRLLGYLGAGPGQDGFVQRSNRLTAVKFFDHIERYQRESEVYHILKDKGIFLIAGQNVPVLIDEDQELRTIEMSIVNRPFLLDFAGAKRPAEVPDFEQHVMEEHLERIQGLFGDRWADALHVAEVFRQHTGFVLLDIHPGNIAFE